MAGKPPFPGFSPAHFQAGFQLAQQGQPVSAPMTMDQMGGWQPPPDQGPFSFSDPYSQGAFGGGGVDPVAGLSLTFSAF